jgi:hypothetical protein
MEHYFRGDRRYRQPWKRRESLRSSSIACRSNNTIRIQSCRNCICPCTLSHSPKPDLGEQALKAEGGGVSCWEFPTAMWKEADQAEPGIKQPPYQKADGISCRRSYVHGILNLTCPAQHRGESSYGEGGSLKPTHSISVRRMWFG